MNYVQIGKNGLDKLMKELDEYKRPQHLYQFAFYYIPSWANKSSIKYFLKRLYSTVAGLSSILLETTDENSIISIYELKMKAKLKNIINGSYHQEPL